MTDELLKVPDCWEFLKATHSPIVMYGTGNGADKILDRFEMLGIRCSGVFASDGFVRQRSFRSFTVMSRDECEKRFGDFICVISFASSLRDVLDNMYAISESHITLAPDVPVYGGGIIDRNWIEKNAGKIEGVRSMLADERSVEVFDSLLAYRYTGRISHLKSSFDAKEDIYRLMPVDSFENAWDLGAYKGDTVEELLELNGKVKINALEPARRSFEKLKVFCAERCPDASLYNYAAYNSRTTLTFSSGGGRGSSANAKCKTIEVEADFLDNLADEKCDYIKYDVEGCEKEAIEGSEQTILRYTPTLCVSLYHRTDDILDIPLQIKNISGQYDFYLRRIEYIPAWDVNLICIPKGR